MSRAQSQGLNDIIEIRKPVAYEEILSLHREAHAFLILGRQSDIKGHELLAGAKLFEYLKARRPIIGVLPHDETRKILRKVGIWTIANDPEAFEAAANNGRPLHQESPKSRAWPEISALARKLTGMAEPPPSKRTISWPAWVADLFRGHSDE